MNAKVSSVEIPLSQPPVLEGRLTFEIKLCVAFKIPVLYALSSMLLQLPIMPFVRAHGPLPYNK